MFIQTWLVMWKFHCLSHLIIQETKWHTECWCNYNYLSKQVSFKSVNGVWTAWEPQWYFTVLFCWTEIELCSENNYNVLVALFWLWMGLYMTSKHDQHPRKNIKKNLLILSGRLRSSSPIATPWPERSECMRNCRVASALVRAVPPLTAQL